MIAEQAATPDEPAELAGLRAELEQIEQLPVEQRAARFEAVNAALTDELSRLDEV